MDSSRFSLPGAYKVQLLQAVDGEVIAECAVKLVVPPTLSVPRFAQAASKITVNWKNVDVSTVDSYIAFWQKGKSPFASPPEPVALVESSWGYIYDKGPNNKFLFCLFSLTVFSFSSLFFLLFLYFVVVVLRVCICSCFCHIFSGPGQGSGGSGHVRRAPISIQQRRGGPQHPQGRR